MTPQIEQILISLVVAAIPTITAYLLGRRRTTVEIKDIQTSTTKKVLNGYGSLVDDLQEQITRLEKKQEEVYQLHQKVDRLIKENQSQRTELTQATLRMTHLETEVDRLRTENHKLGIAAEQLRQQVLAGWQLPK